MMWYEKIIAELSVRPVQPWLVVGVIVVTIVIFVVEGLLLPRETPESEQVHPNFSDQRPDHPDWF